MQRAQVQPDQIDLKCNFGKTIVTLNPECLGDRLKVKRLHVLITSCKTRAHSWILQDVEVACTVLVIAWPMPVVVFSSCLSLPTGDCHVCFQDLGMSQLDDWAVHHYPLNGPKRGGVWVEIVSYNNLFSRYTMILVRFYTLGGGQVTSAGGRIFSKFDFPPKKRIMSVFLPPENPWKKHAPRMNTDKKNHMKTHHWENTVESDLPAVLSGLPSHLCGNSWAGQGGENVNHHRKQGTSSRNLPYTSKWGRYVFFLIYTWYFEKNIFTMVINLWFLSLFFVGW